jgi:hypothetical protein
MEKYKWVPADDDGFFVRGNKWVYIRGNQVLARIVKYTNSEQWAAGIEYQCGDNWFTNINAAAEYIERNYK